MADIPCAQDTDNNKGPECPWCHHVVEPDDQYFFNDDRNDYQCGWCDEPFTFTYHRTDRWHAKRKHYTKPRL